MSNSECTYAVVRKHDKKAYENIVAFASALGQGIESDHSTGSYLPKYIVDVIPLQLRAQVESFIMEQVAKQIQKKLDAVQQAEIRTIQAQRKFKNSLDNHY